MASLTKSDINARCRGMHASPCPHMPRTEPKEAHSNKGNPFQQQSRHPILFLSSTPTTLPHSPPSLYTPSANKSIRPLSPTSPSTPSPTFSPYAPSSPPPSTLPTPPSFFHHHPPPLCSPLSPRMPVGPSSPRPSQVSSRSSEPSPRVRRLRRQIVWLSNWSGLRRVKSDGGY